MTRFSGKKTGTAVANLAGGHAFKEIDDLEFVSLLLTSFAEDKFYESGKAQIERVTQLIGNAKDSQYNFIANAISYARHEFGLRSITHVAAVEFARRFKGKPGVASFVAQMVRRPDDAVEMLGYCDGNMPHAVRKGVALALAGFDEYQVSKYKCGTRGVTLVDAVNLTHPKATPVISALVKGALQPPETWEVVITRAGGEPAAKRSAWEWLVREKKLGHFALLRNLSNIATHAPDAIDAACAQLVDVPAKSMLFPYRYWTAYETLVQRGLEGGNKIIKAIDQALSKALANTPEFPGRNLIALDCSGSMQGDGFTQGAILAAALAKQGDTDLVLFDMSAQYITASPLGSPLDFVKILASKCEWGGTNFRVIFESAKRAYDRIFIFSDMQAWTESPFGSNAVTAALREYRQRFNCDPLVYSVDLAGYGTLQFPQPNVVCLAGFSDKIFDLMQATARGGAGLLNAIKEWR